MEVRGKYDCSQCKSKFEYEEIKIRYDKYGDLVLKKLVCPYCGSTAWSNYEDRKKLDKYLQFSIN